MESRDEILKELKGIAPNLAALDKVHLHKAPANYFVNFKSVMLEKVKMSEAREELKAVAPELAKLDKLKQAVISADYFTGFSSSILNKVRANEVANELASIAPTLSAIKKVESIEVPAGYFTAMPARMAAIIEAEQKTAEAAMPVWMQQLNAGLEVIISAVFKPRYTFAFAGVATSVVLAVMMFTQVTVQECDFDCKLAQLSATELNEYIGDRPDEFSKSVLDESTDSKRLLDLNEKGTLHLDNYLRNEITDDDLENVVI